MELQRAWLLHSRPYKERSVIAEFLVEHHGRIAMVARGVRQARSTHAALLQPFNTVLVNWKGRGELKTLITLEPAVNRRLSGNALYCGFYINELLLRAMIPGHDLEGIAELYTGVIDHLTEPDVPIEPLLRSFELELLEITGYAPPLDYEAITGAPLNPGAIYRLQENAGLLPVALPVPSALRARCYSAELLLALAQRDFSQPEFYNGFKRFTRQALKPLLGERPLQSRALFQSSQRLNAASD